MQIVSYREALAAGWECARGRDAALRMHAHETHVVICKFDSGGEKEVKLSVRLAMLAFVGCHFDCVLRK